MANQDVLPPLTPELFVRDLRASLEFYVGLLGFSVQFERRDEGFAAIALDGAYFMLENIDHFREASDHQFVEERKWITGNLAYPFGRGLNFLIHAEDIDSIYDRLLKHGYPIKLPMEKKWYRVGRQEIGVRQFMVMDPDGFLLRFDKDIGRRTLE